MPVSRAQRLGKKKKEEKNTASFQQMLEGFLWARVYDGTPEYIMKLTWLEGQDVLIPSLTVATSPRSNFTYNCQEELAS